MSKRLPLRITVACYIAAAGLLVGSCDKTPTQPSNSLTVTRVEPSSGPTDTAFPVTIHGTGFESGATVTLGGQTAAVTSVTPSLITATAPPHAQGAVDVVVTNLRGRSATLVGGFAYVPLAVTSIAPEAGFAGSVVRVGGTGFLAGAVVTFDGVPAAAASITATVITVTSPAHAMGAVDVVVTNPGGRTGMIAQGFTYSTPTLTVASTQVTSRQDVIVTWVAPNPSSSLDWIGLFRVGSTNEEYLEFFWAYTGGHTSGTLRYGAPHPPGEYEFRYLLNDGYVDVARSQIVTVSAVPEPFSNPIAFLRSVTPTTRR